MSGIKEEAHQKDDPEDNGEYRPYGIGNIIDRILDVVEQGTHTELIDKKQFYYTLVKNQLNI